MDRQEYTDRVVSVLRRLTPAERNGVRAEIDAHIEDHMDALLALGYDPELAEERTMAAMGNPEEVGRELDKQYPLRWLVLGRAAVVLTILVCVQAVLGLGVLFNAWDSLEARIRPDSRDSVLDRVAVEEQVDYQTHVGNDVVRVFRISVGEKSNGNRELVPTAEVQLCVYDRIPCGIASERVPQGLVLKDQRGQATMDSWGGGSGSYGAVYARRWVSIQPGDTYVTLEYEQFGEQFSLDIPLPGEEGAS